MKKNTKRTDRTKLDIVDAYIQVASKVSIDKVRVKSVVAKSGYSHQTFYRYFKNIQDLQNFVDKLVKPELHFTNRDIRRFPHNDNIEDMTRRGIQLLKNHLEKIRLANTPEVRKRFEEDFRNMMNDILIKVPGQVPERNMELIKLLASYHINGTIHMFFDYVNSQGKFKLPMEYVGRLFAELYCRGIVGCHHFLRNKELPETATTFNGKSNSQDKIEDSIA